MAHVILEAEKSQDLQLETQESRQGSCVLGLSPQAGARGRILPSFTFWFYSGLQGIGLECFALLSFRDSDVSLTQKCPHRHTQDNAGASGPSQVDIQNQLRIVRRTPALR